MWRTPYPTISVLAIDTMPEGMLRRAAFGAVKPKFRISVAEYVVITPLEVEIWKKRSA